MLKRSLSIAIFMVLLFLLVIWYFGLPIKEEMKIEGETEINEINDNSYLPISDCGTINISGNYSLSEDIFQNEPQDCILINADDVVLDCNGRTIELDFERKTAITSTGDNTVIKNWLINGNPQGYGIKFNRVDFGEISNNNLNGFRVGIWILEQSTNDTIKNNEVTQNFDGILIQNTFDSVVKNNSLVKNNRYGMNVINSHDMKFFDNLGCDNEIKDFYCSNSKRANGSDNKFQTIENCEGANSFPKIKEGYEKCKDDSIATITGNILKDYFNLW
jgi:parallel beta-helix repeat protein